MATPTELFNRVRVRINDEGGQASDPRLADSFLLRYLNEGLRDFCRRTGATQKTVNLAMPTTGSVALPSDFYKPKGSYLDGIELDLTEMSSIRQSQAVDNPSAPTISAIWGRTLYVAPLPESAVTVVFDYYAISPASAPDIVTDLNQTADVEDAICEYIISKAWLALEESQYAAQAKALYEQMVETAQKDFEGPPIMQNFFNEIILDWE